MSEKLTLSVPEAARLLGVTPVTLRDAIARGVVPAIRIGRRNVRVPRGAVLELVAGRQISPAPEHEAPR